MILFDLELPIAYYKWMKLKTQNPREKMLKQNVWGTLDPIHRKVASESRHNQYVDHSCDNFCECDPNLLLTGPRPMTSLDPFWVRHSRTFSAASCHRALWICRIQGGWPWARLLGSGRVRLQGVLQRSENPSKELKFSFEATSDLSRG